jgi:hypothetical protein
LPHQSAVILFNKIQCSTFVFGAKEVGIEQQEDTPWSSK